MSVSKKTIKDVVKDELNKQKVLGLSVSDEELIPPRPDYPFGEEKASEEGKVIDELLASVPRNQGYYLKIYKEVQPNEFELKLRIDNYESWSDLEWEINSVVRNYTKKSPHKWGSGRYRIIIWRDGGVRGNKFKPLDFWIDAMEEPKNEPVSTQESMTAGEKVREQVNTLTELVRTLREVNPSMNPAETQKMLVDAFKSGTEAKTAEKTAEVNSQNTLLQVLVPILSELVRAKSNTPDPSAGLSGIVNDLIKKVVDDQGKKTDPLELLKQLKEAGILPNQTAVAPIDPVSSFKSQLEMFTAMIPLFQAIAGGRSSDTGIGVELVRSIGPQIKDIIKNVTDTINKVVDSKANSLKTPPAKPKEISSVDQEPVMINPPSTNGAVAQEVKPELPPVFLPLKNAIESRDHKYFSDLEDLLLKYGNETYFSLLDDKVALDQVLMNIAPVSGSWIVSPESRIYFTEFLGWAKEKRAKAIQVKCTGCQTTWEIDRESWTADSKCPECGGVLETANA